MRKVLIPILAAALAMVAAVASAHPYGKGFLDKFDSDGDGKVTQDEFLAASKARFERMDADQNGKISSDEMRTYMIERREARMEEKFKRIDADGDGSVNRDEYLGYQRARAEKHFLRMDADGDGQLSSAEFMAHQAKRPRRRSGAGKMFEYLDKDRDGIVSAEESNAAWSEWFKKIDLDGDKIITQTEMEEYRMNKWKPGSRENQ